MKLVPRLTAMAMACGIVCGCSTSGAGIGLSSDPPSPQVTQHEARDAQPVVLQATEGQNSSKTHQNNTPRPVIFRNYMDGFEFEVPPGWIISTFYENGNTTVSIRRETPSLEDGFDLRQCPGPTPEDCMGDDGMLATLVKVTDIQMGAYPAKEYTYDRQTVSRTRLWKEVVSVLQVKGHTYAVIVKIPYPEVEDQYLMLNRQIRNSFRLIRP